MQSCTDARVIDVGKGASVTVLDLSAYALDIARQRLGADALRVQWIIYDIHHGTASRVDVLLPA